VCADASCSLTVCCVHLFADVLVLVLVLELELDLVLVLVLVMALALPVVLALAVPLLVVAFVWWSTIAWCPSSRSPVALPRPGGQSQCLCLFWPTAILCLASRRTVR